MLAVGLLLWMDPPGDVLGELAAIDPVWVIAAAGLELASLISYVIVFHRLFAPAPAGRREAWRGSVLERAPCFPAAISRDSRQAVCCFTVTAFPSAGWLFARLLCCCGSTPSASL